MNIYQIFRNQVLGIVDDLVSNGHIESTEALNSVVVEPSKNPMRGELATNVALIIGNSERKNPIEVAHIFGDILAQDEKISSIEIAKPGFINFSLTFDTWLTILGKAFLNPFAFGSNDRGKGKKINVEYISANPTGPLHVGHTRGAVFGDALANLLVFNGYKITREYYVNDAGSQVDSLARSVFLRYLELHGQKVTFDKDSYPGEYLVEVAEKLKEKYGRSFITKKESDWLPLVKKFATDTLLNSIKSDLALLEIRMDKFYSEKQLYESGKIERALEALRKKGLIYRGTLPPPKGKVSEDYEAKEQTLFKSTAFGDDVDRPIKKSDGGWTYFAPDVAYHFDKIERGYDELIDVFGADHSGYVKRMKAAVTALSNGSINLDIKLCQLVRLFKNGSPYKMSKRAGNFVTLSDMVNEVGKDVVRFLMLTRKNDAPLEFDFAKALEQSKDNAVFYVQYAHARCCSIINKALELNIDVKNIELNKIKLVKLSSKSENRIIRKIAEWPRVIEIAGISHEPHRIVSYLYELASEIHGYQHEGKLNNELKVLCDDHEILMARLVLIFVAKAVIGTGLKIVGVSPLTKM